MCIISILFVPAIAISANAAILNGNVSSKTVMITDGYNNLQLQLIGQNNNFSIWHHRNQF